MTQNLLTSSIAGYQFKQEGNEDSKEPISSEKMFSKSKPRRIIANKGIDKSVKKLSISLSEALHKNEQIDDENIYFLSSNSNRDQDQEPLKTPDKPVDKVNATTAATQAQTKTKATTNSSIPSKQKEIVVIKKPVEASSDEVLQDKVKESAALSLKELKSEPTTQSLQSSVTSLDSSLAEYESMRKQYESLIGSVPIPDYKPLMKKFLNEYTFNRMPDSMKNGVYPSKIYKDKLSQLEQHCNYLDITADSLKKEEMLYKQNII